MGNVIKDYDEEDGSYQLVRPDTSVRQGKSGGRPGEGKSKVDLKKFGWEQQAKNNSAVNPVCATQGVTEGVRSGVTDALRTQ